MSVRTCRWCGKRYESTNSFRGGVKNYESYCSSRCENAANSQRIRDKKRSDAEWENSWFMKQWRKLPLKWKVIIIGGLFIAAYIGSRTE